MKKLSLKDLELEANNMLQRSQLKTILGGGYEGSWFCVCNNSINIGGVPSCTSSNCDRACKNQGGWSGACGCGGSGC